MKNINLKERFIVKLINLPDQNIFTSKAQALVNPVNCVGVMGAGLAKQFKQKYPNNFNRYHDICKSELLTIGKCLTVAEAGKLIVNFPTKDHWQNDSKIEYILEGMKALLRHIEKYKIESIAIPALGCGLGKLDKDQVRLIIENSLKDLNIEVELYF